MANLFVQAAILLIKVAIVAATTVGAAAAATGAAIATAATAVAVAAQGAAVATATFFGFGTGAAAAGAATGAGGGTGSAAFGAAITGAQSAVSLATAAPVIGGGTQAGLLALLGTAPEAAAVGGGGGFFASISGAITGASEAYSGLSLGTKVLLQAGGQGLQAGFGALKERQEISDAKAQADVNRDFNNNQLDVRFEEEVASASVQLQQSRIKALQARGSLAVSVQARGLSIRELLNDTLAESGRDQARIQTNLDFKAKQLVANKASNDLRVSAIRQPSGLVAALRIGGAALAGAATAGFSAVDFQGAGIKSVRAAVTGVASA